MLRFYNEFIAILEAEPNNRFERLEDHYFVAFIKEKLYLAGVSDDVFLAWRQEVQRGFFNRNLPALAITNFPRHLGDVSHPFQSLMMDPRCFVDHINSLSAHYQALHAQSTQQQEAIANLTALVHQMSFQLQQQSQLLQNLLTGVVTPLSSPTKTNSTPNVHTTPNQPTTITNDPQEEVVVIPPSPSFVKRFSVSVKSLPSAATITERFRFFFAEEAREGYEKDKELMKDDTGDTAKKEKTRIRNDFTRLKKTVKLMLLFCDEYPSPQPKNPQERQAWLVQLREKATAAESKMHDILYPDKPDKSMTQSTLTATEFKSMVKSWENEQRLPEDTPEEVVSWFADGTTSKNKKRKADDDGTSNNKKRKTSM